VNYQLSDTERKTAREFYDENCSCLYCAWVRLDREAEMTAAFGPEETTFADVEPVNRFSVLVTFSGENVETFVLLAPFNLRSMEMAKIMEYAVGFIMSQSTIDAWVKTGSVAPPLPIERYNKIVLQAVELAVKPW
jgi:hypothetical protein